MRKSAVLTNMSLAMAAIFGIGVPISQIARAAAQHKAIVSDSATAATDGHITDVDAAVTIAPDPPASSRYVLPRYHPKSFRFSSTPRKPRGLGSKSNRQIAGVKKRRAGR